MNNSKHSSLSWLLNHISQTAGAVAVAVGFLVFCGWWFDLTLLKSAFSGLVAMKVNTALGFILSGISLWNTSPSVQQPLSRIVSQACAASVLLLGLLTVAEYLSGMNFGIDELVMLDMTNLPGDIPGRMAVNTAVSFVALGAALMLLSHKKGGFVLTIHLLAIATILIAGSSLVSYGYNLEGFLRAKLNYTPMALHTAMVFVLLGLGLLNARPDYPFRDIMTSASSAGDMARRMWPPAIGLQLAMGWLLLKGLQTGYLSEAVGLAFFAVSNIAGLSALIQWNASRLYQTDALRQQAENVQRKIAEEFEDLYNHAPVGYHSLDQEGRYFRINDTELAWLGYEREEVIGIKYFTDLLTTESQQAFQKNYPVFKQLGWMQDLEFDMIRKDRSVLPVLLSATAIKDDSGNFQLSRSTVYDITERRRMEAVLRERERHTRQLLAVLPTGVVIHGPDSSIRYGNAAALKLLGLTEDQLFGKTGFDPYWHFVRDDGSVMPVEEYPVNRVIAENQSIRDYLVGIAHSAATEPRWVYVNAFPDLDSQGKLREVIVSFVDITERKRAEESLRESEGRYRSVIAALFEGIILMDAQGVIQASNDSAERILGLSVEQLAGRTSFDPCWQSIHEDGSSFPGERHPAWVTLQTGQPCHNVIMGIHKPDGSLTWLSINSQPLYRPGNAKPNAVVISFADITERKHVEEELRALQIELREAAIRDPLTGLYNRRYLDETLNRELARAAREGQPISIFMGDIDYFKQLNDTYGHQAGDGVLKALGKVLREHARTSDIPCRYGGEEFVVILPDMPLEAARERADLVRQNFSALCFTFGDTQVGSTLSIGVSVYPDHGTTADELIGSADQALYEAKQTGRNKVCLPITLTL
ncbi:MAG: sensor domain-containing diguanylate cyclase [Methylomonas sp.]